MSINDDFLRVNSEAYEWLVKNIYTINRRSEPKTVLRQIVTASRFSAVFHPRRFADVASSNKASEIGVRLDTLAVGTGGIPVWCSRMKILPVTFDVRGIGGHKWMLCNFVRNHQYSSLRFIGDLA